MKRDCSSLKKEEKVLYKQSSGYRIGTVLNNNSLEKKVQLFFIESLFVNYQAVDYKDLIAVYDEKGQIINIHNYLGKWKYLKP